MKIFKWNVVKYCCTDKKGYYIGKIKIPNKIGEYLWNKQTPLWIHKCNFNGYIKNQCNICGRYKNEL